MPGASITILSDLPLILLFIFFWFPHWITGINTVWIISCLPLIGNKKKIRFSSDGSCLKCLSSENKKKRVWRLLEMAWNPLTTICQLMSNQYWIDCGVIAGEEISSGSFVWWRSPATFLSFFSSSKRQIPTDFNQRGNSVFWSWWIENSIDAGKYSSSYIIWVLVRRRVVFWNVLCGRHSIALSRHAAICWQRNDWECPLW